MLIRFRSCKSLIVIRSEIVGVVLVASINSSCSTSDPLVGGGSSGVDRSRYGSRRISSTRTTAAFRNRCCGRRRSRVHQEGHLSLS